MPLALVAWGGYSIANHGNPAVAMPPPPVVTVATPITRSIDQWDDYVGRFEATKTVEVRPRVSGEVTAVHFKDGAVVRTLETTTPSALYAVADQTTDFGGPVTRLSIALHQISQTFGRGAAMRTMLYV